MEPIAILRSDALDILFENRNKQYGAYALRREYPQHLRVALAAMVGIVLMAWLLLPSSNKPPKILSNPFIPADSVVLIVLPPKEIPPAPQPEMQTPKPQPPVATVKNVVPVIVPDDQQTDLVPTIDEMDDKLISTVNQDGPVSDGTVRPAEGDGNGVAAPIEVPVEKEPEILITAAVMPSFPGGNQALQRWLSRNLRPQEGQEPGRRIRVVARFVVDMEGRISGIQLVQSGGEPYDQEVLRVIRKMPTWNPGKQNGKSVSVWFNIPIIFETPAD